MSVPRQRAAAAAGVALAFLAAAGSPVRAETSAKPPSARGFGPVKFDVRTGVVLSHTSNLYHVKSAHEQLFRTETDEYERFHRMKGPSDVLAEIDLGVSWTWKHVSKRAITFRLGASQVQHGRNGIADHSEIRLDASFDVTRRDRLGVSLARQPGRFLKNYRYEAFPGIAVFGRADATQAEWALEYRRTWLPKWRMTFAGARRKRDFRTPFDNRDQDRTSFSVLSKHDLGSRVELDVEVGREAASTGRAAELGVVKDRSYAEKRAAVALEVRLPRRWRCDVEVERTWREYTTSVPEDESRYGRDDRMLAVGIEAERRWKSGWAVTFGWKRTGRRTDLPVPDDEMEDVGYRETVVSAGTSWRN